MTYDILFRQLCLKEISKRDRCKLIISLQKYF